MVNKLSVNLGGIKLDNPVIPASGTFGFGQEMAEVYDLDILGSIAVKGTTREARYGNPLPRLRRVFHKPIVANISGFSIEEYAYCCEKIDKEDQIGIIEVNISCPNVHHGGMAFGTSPEMAARVTKAVKKVTSKPVFIKLSPNVTDITAIAKACEEAGADGLTLVNTFLGMRIDIERRQPVLARKVGGYSGRSIFPIALRMVYEVAQVCHIPIMGCGGVSKAEDVIEMMMAGATAVQVGAENLRNPYACKEIIDNLPKVMERLNIDTLESIIGEIK